MTEYWEQLVADIWDIILKDLMPTVKTIEDLSNKVNAWKNGVLF